MHNFITENNHQPLDQTPKPLTTDTGFGNSTSQEFTPSRFPSTNVTVISVRDQSRVTDIRISTQRHYEQIFHGSEQMSSLAERNFPNQ